ncbi:hypothetical protein COOONC_20715 [Cooperia oncophora]
MDKTEAAGAQNKIAVIGVLLQASSSGVALQNLENTFTEIRTPGSQSSPLNYSLESLVPNDTSAFFRFDGSLTTPPCSEGVIWTVLREPSQVSYKQELFEELNEDS